MTMVDPNFLPYTSYSELINAIRNSSAPFRKNPFASLGIETTGFGNSMPNIAKFFQTQGIADIVNGFAVNLKAASVLSDIYLDKPALIANSFSGFLANNPDIGKILDLNVPLYRVKHDSLLNYLKHPIFDLYDLNSEVTVSSIEDSELIELDTYDELIETNDDSSQILIVTPFKRIIDKVKHDSIDNLHWREFEELISELLREEGWDVELLRGTKDGGADIIATSECEHIGLVKCVWQAKKYSIKNKVGLPTIRELADTRNELKASKAILVTTSFLTKGAKDRIQNDQHIFAKKERDEVECWISKFTN